MSSVINILRNGFCMPALPCVAEEIMKILINVSSQPVPTLSPQSISKGQLLPLISRMYDSKNLKKQTFVKENILSTYRLEICGSNSSIKSCFIEVQLMEITRFVLFQRVWSLLCPSSLVAVLYFLTSDVTTRTSHLQLRVCPQSLWYIIVSIWLPSVLWSEGHLCDWRSSWNRSRG